MWIYSSYFRPSKKSNNIWSIPASHSLAPWPEILCSSQELLVVKKRLRYDGKARRGQLTTYPSVAGKLYMSSFHRACPLQVKNSTKNAVWTFLRQVMHLWCPAENCQLTYWTNSSAQCKRSHEYRVACATWWDNRLQAKPAHFRDNPITIHKI